MDDEETSFPDTPNSSVPIDNTLACDGGTFIPIWYPLQDVGTIEVVLRGVVYILAMYFLFIGIAYLADIFMSSVEMITSTKKEVRITNDRTGQEEVMVVRVWNQTVANLTLIALGGAAPEVLLSTIELIKHDFKAEELGPSEIVSSAAFNCMIVIGVCIYVIPRGESRRVVEFPVLIVVVLWCLSAYIWLTLVTAVISVGEVEIWEAIVTLLLFPCVLASAFWADRISAARKRKQNVTYQVGLKNKVLVETKTDILPIPILENHQQVQHFKEFEDDRRDFITILKELRLKHPQMDSKQLEILTTKTLLDGIESKTKAIQWMKTSKKLTGLETWRMSQDSKMIDLDLYQRTPRPSISNCTEVFFSPGHYTVEECIGSFATTVVRHNGDLTQTVLVDYTTEDADAIQGRDYEPTSGTLMFQPGQASQKIEIRIIDDSVYKGDRTFYIRLSNLRSGGNDQERGTIDIDAYSLNVPRSRSGSQVSITSPSMMIIPVPNLLNVPSNIQEAPMVLDVKTLDGNQADGSLCLACPSLATVFIMDDDHHGIFTLANSEIEIRDSTEYCVMQIIRCGGTKGKVILPYRTEDGTAEAGRDYEPCEGQLTFDDGEIEKIVTVPISPNKFYVEDLIFFFNLGEPSLYNSINHIRNKKENELDGMMIDKPSNKIPSIKIDLIDDDQTDKIGNSFVAGHPRLGEIEKTAIRLKESKEFKNSLNRMLKRAHLNVKFGVSPWKQQFIDAIHWERDEDYEEEFGVPKPISWFDYIKYPLTLFWRLLFALIPPTELFGGFATFVGSLFFIAILVVFLDDFAYELGCTVGLEIRVTSLALVSVGTNLPDLLASRVFAKRSPTADACITNVFGSNIIQVYLGLGICWTIGSFYHYANGETFKVNPGTLSFMAPVFLIMAVVVVVILVLRRYCAGGELGGPNRIKIPTTIGFISLWLTFVLVNSFQVYGYIDSFWVTEP